MHTIEDAVSAVTVPCYSFCNVISAKYTTGRMSGRVMCKRAVCTCRFQTCLYSPLQNSAGIQSWSHKHPWMATRIALHMQYNLALFVIHNESPVSALNDRHVICYLRAFSRHSRAECTVYIPLQLSFCRVQHFLKGCVTRS